MKQFKEIYNLQNDTRRIEMVQNASLDNLSRSGFRVENELLFGTEEWFNAVESGLIPKHVVQGTICNVMMTGHTDYPEFEIESNRSKSIWTRYGAKDDYTVGVDVELIYVEQRYKYSSAITGAVSKCIIQVKIAV